MTGAGGSKLSLLGFSEITFSIGRFTFTEEFTVIEGMVSDMLQVLNGSTSLTCTPVGPKKEFTTYREAT